MYNETYDEYIRSILGYPTMNVYENNSQDYRNQNMYFDNNMFSNTNLNTNMNSDSMDDIDLESCYPEIYKIVYPMICKKCDNVRGSVTNEDIQNMTEEIFYALEERNEIQLNINLTNEVRSTKTSNTPQTIDKKPEVRISETSNEKRETRQFNRGLRDLIQILLIRELLRRRRRRPGMPPSPRPPMPEPRPPMRPPMRPPFRPGFDF